MYFELSLTFGCLYRWIKLGNNLLPLDQMKKRTKRTVELIIVIIWGITTIAITVATAGVALHQSIENVLCVQRRHSDAGKL